MNRIALLYNKLYDFDNCKFTLGGIQTYVINLISICKEMNIYVEFFQMGDSNNNTVFNGIVINQINTHNYQEFSNKVKELTIASTGTAKIIHFSYLLNDSCDIDIKVGSNTILTIYSGEQLADFEIEVPSNQSLNIVKGTTATTEDSVSIRCKYYIYG